MLGIDGLDTPFKPATLSRTTGQSQTRNSEAPLGRTGQQLLSWRPISTGEFPPKSSLAAQAAHKFRAGLGLGNPGLGESLGICAMQVAPSKTLLCVFCKLPPVPALVAPPSGIRDDGGRNGHPSRRNDSGKVAIAVHYRGRRDAGLATRPSFHPRLAGHRSKRRDAVTLSEFKAWFEGFTESMDGPPSHKQWERIQARVKQISAAPIIERIIHDWWPREHDRPYRAFLAGDRAAYSLNASPSSDGVGRAAFSVRTSPVDDNDCRPVDVASVLRSLGKADAEALKAA